MKRLDREALRRAIRMAREDPATDDQINRMFADREHTWDDIATTAAAHCQCSTLHLRPWEMPPMHVGDAEPVNDPNRYGLRAAWELRRRLIASGLSMYEPDPLGALAALAAATTAV